MPSIVNIQGLVSNELNNNSSISSGENLQFGYSTPQKRIYSLNNTGIFCMVLYTMDWVFDSAIIDNLVLDQNANVGSTM